MRESTDLGAYQIPKEVADKFAKHGADMAIFAVHLLLGTLDEENRRLCKDLAEAREDIDRAEKLASLYQSRLNEEPADRTRIDQLERAIRWALGEIPEGAPPLGRRHEGEPADWWRKKLRDLAELPEKEEQ